VAVALAYVLSQAFPLFALIGPANMAEIRTSFDALDVDLTPREIGWLEKGGKDPSMDQALGKRKRMARHRDGVR
jgi:aryl-alcohol dehydrogenase-like predicted oxidoreductase